MIRLAGIMFGVFLFIGPATALAQAAIQDAIVVRSGEHDGFSRLVFGPDLASNWALEQQDGGYRLSFTGLSAGFDIAQIYRFIPRTRLRAITSLAAPETGYFLDVASDHMAEAFVTKRGLLVVDIKVGQRPPDPVSDPTPMRGQIPRIETEQRVLAPPDARLAQRKAGLAKTGIVYKPQRPATSDPPFRLPPIKVLEAQQRLQDVLQTARRQGVILTAKKPSETGNSAPAPPTSAEIAVSPTTKTGNFLDHLNLEAQTVYDRDNTGAKPRKTPKAINPNCLDDGQFDLENWGTDDPGGRISGLRRNLVREFDKVNAADLEKLVKLYVFLGFGTEARALLGTYDGVLKNQKLLNELAFLIEDGSVQAKSILADQMDCEGRSALWAILARDSIPLGEVPDGQRIADIFAELPAGLRQRIGPRLGTLLLDAGFDTAARKILNLITRAAGTESPALDLLNARLALRRGKTQKAEKLLNGLVAANSPNAPEALFYLVGSLIERAKPVSDDLLVDLAARALELRGSPLGAKLLLLEIRALARQQRQAQAFEILTHEAILKTIDPETANENANYIFLSFDLDNADPDYLVETYFKYRNLLTNDAGMDRARHHIARGVLQAGLPETALKIMAPAGKRFLPKDILLVGESELALERPDKTLDLIEGMDSPEVRALKVRALAQKRDFALAFDNAGTEAASDLKDNLAWRAGRWNAVAQSNIESRRNASGFIENRKTPTGAPAETLTDFADLAQASATARADIDQLLKDHPFP
jgi:hypothetical protein